MQINKACMIMSAIGVHLAWSLQWRNNERDGVWKHRRFHCLRKCRFSSRSKKTSKVNSPRKRPVTRKIFPFDDVIMIWLLQTRDVVRTSVNSWLTYSWVSLTTHSVPPSEQLHTIMMPREVHFCFRYGSRTGSILWQRTTQKKLMLSDYLGNRWNRPNFSN